LPRSLAARQAASGQDLPERHRMGSPSYQSFQRVTVVAGWVIRRWQPGQSNEGGLLAGGQYTNLSVRQ